MLRALGLKIPEPMLKILSWILAINPSHSHSLCCRFDGDGMVHACRIKGGKASYSNHLVKTHRLQRELKQGFPLYLRVHSHPTLPCLFLHAACWLLACSMHCFSVM